jgi:acetyl esterase/lipase
MALPRRPYIPALTAAATVVLAFAGPAPDGDRQANAKPPARDGAAAHHRAVSARFALDGPRGLLVRRAVPARGAAAGVEVYRRAGERRDAPAVLLVHGGGWSGGSKARMAPYARRLARAGFVAFNAGYTLAAPGLPAYGVQPRQLRAVVRWIRRESDRFGVDRRRIGALGSSAGGHLAALLATDGRGPRGGGARLAAAVTWSAPLDLSSLAQHHMLGPAATRLLGCPLSACPDRWAATSPLAHVDPGDPPMLLFNSRRELVPLRQSLEMSARLTAAAVPHALRIVEGNRHARDYAGEVWRETIAFLREELH